MAWGDIDRGDIDRGDLVWGDFGSGGFCPGGFCPGGFCPGGFCPVTITDESHKDICLNMHINTPYIVKRAVLIGLFIAEI